eukprot:scaffold757_cov246-Pinguiococcus_pyrenoidosus.AAC.26
MLCTLGSASSRDSRVSSGLLVAAFCVPATTSSRFLACGNGPAPPPCQGTALRSTCSTARADDGPFCLCCRGSSRFALAARLLLEVAGLADWAVATAGVVVPMSSLETMGGRSRSKFPSLCCQSTRVDAMSTCLELMSGASITTTSSSMIGLPLAADDLRLRDSFLPEGFASLFTETRSPLEVQMTSKSQRQRGHLTLLPRDATCAHWSKQVVWKDSTAPSRSHSCPPLRPPCEPSARAAQHPASPRPSQRTQHTREAPGRASLARATATATARARAMGCFPRRALHFGPRLRWPFPELLNFGTRRSRPLRRLVSRQVPGQQLVRLNEPNLTAAGPRVADRVVDLTLDVQGRPLEDADAHPQRVTERLQREMIAVAADVGHAP